MNDFYKINLIILEVSMIHINTTDIYINLSINIYTMKYIYNTVVV